MLKEALTKLQTEITAAAKQPHAAAFGSYMMDRIRNHPDEAENVLAVDKTLAGAISVVTEEAKKHIVNGCAYIPDEECFVIVLKYYGIAVQTTAPTPEPMRPMSISVTLDDLF